MTAAHDSAGTAFALGPRGPTRPLLTRAVRGLAGGVLGLAVALGLVALLVGRLGFGDTAAAAIAVTAAILAFYAIAGGLLSNPMRALAAYRSAAGVFAAVGLAGLGLAMLGRLLLLELLGLASLPAHGLTALLALGFVGVALADLLFSPARPSPGPQD